MAGKWLFLFSALLALHCIIGCKNFCPAPEDILPCICHPPPDAFEEYSKLECKKINKVTDIENALERNADYPFETMEVFITFLKYFPVQAFRITKIQNIVITNSKFTNLFDEDFTMEVPSIKKVELVTVEVKRGIDWKQFSPLSHLEALLMSRVTTVKITQTFAQNIPKSITEVRLSNCGIKKFVDGSFARLSNLAYLSATDNKIKTLSRSMFPDSLYDFNLRNNEISSLPTNLFEGMSNLTYVNLESNKITTIDKSTFTSLPKLKYVELKDNPINCDCKIKWITSSKVHIRGAVCVEPTKLKGRQIEALKADDFSHCTNF